MKTETIKKIYKQLTPESSREFAYFSANLQHICGLPLGETHLRHYHRLKQYFTEQAALDLRSGLTAGKTNQRLKYAIDHGPSLFVSFHYGSYRTLPLKILAQGRSICVLLSQEVYDVYADYYRKILDIPRVNGEFICLKQRTLPSSLNCVRWLQTTSPYSCMPMERKELCHCPQSGVCKRLSF